MKHRTRSPRRRGATIVLGLAIAAAVTASAWLLLDGPSGGASRTSPTPPAVEFAFTLDKMRVNAVPEPWNNERARRAAQAVRAALTSFYVTGFVDPGAWAGGEFPEAFAGFDKAAAGRARRDLDALTLGRFASSLDWVQPDDSHLVVTVLLDAHNRAVGAVAEVRFVATAHRAAGGTLPIENRANYLLRPGGGGWTVFSYEATTRVGGADPSSGATEATA
ncbi:MAG TPA: hypothetical protein VEO00_07185 [Actinomycetota bacterium]|nr:hypothetical protein [Actinomycetota bacterium]